MRVADYIIQYLKKKNIKNFFSVTGRGSLFLNDALARDKDAKSFFFHHEQSAAFAAITTPNIDNNISCCMVSTGCASTNTITAVLSAWQDSLPVIFISGQNFLNETTGYKKNNIRTNVHYLPIFMHPFYYNKKHLNNKNSLDYYNEALSIPLYVDLKKKEQDKIIRIIFNFFKERIK